MKTDQRRYGVIEVRRLSGDCFHLVIGGEMWSEVEWSASRQSWCIQDAAVNASPTPITSSGKTGDIETAIRLAKHMIVDGTMPTPEEALQQLKSQQKQNRQNERPLGEPMEILGERMRVLELVTRRSKP